MSDVATPAEVMEFVCRADELADIPGQPGYKAPKPWELIFAQIPFAPAACRCLSCTGVEVCPEGDLPFGKSDDPGATDRLHPEYPREWQRKPRMVFIQDGKSHLVNAEEYLRELYRMRGIRPPVEIGAPEGREGPNPAA